MQCALLVRLAPLLAHSRVEQQTLRAGHLNGALMCCAGGFEKTYRLLANCTDESVCVKLVQV
jgi:hypothetical protein